MHDGPPVLSGELAGGLIPNSAGSGCGGVFDFACLMIGWGTDGYFSRAQHFLIVIGFIALLFGGGIWLMSVLADSAYGQGVRQEAITTGLEQKFHEQEASQYIGDKLVKKEVAEINTPS
jgi:hypothetical protein